MMLLVGAVENRGKGRRENRDRRCIRDPADTIQSHLELLRQSKDPKSSARHATTHSFGCIDCK
eukprot:scaffold14541_cov137-Skeletonema_menzelii.AAC.3